MASYSVRYGYHVAKDYQYNTQDIFREVAIRWLKGTFPKSKARELLNQYNQKVNGSGIDQFNEIEIEDIISKI